MPKIKPLYIGIALLMAMGIASYSFFPSHPAVLDQNNAKSYVSGRYGISFLYPNSYHVSERELSTVAPLHHLIVLSGGATSSAPKNGETPPGITIDIYENEPEFMSALDFIHADPTSNFKLATSPIKAVPRGTLHGLEYTWTGLYEGRSYVVAKRGFIYKFNVAGGNERPNLASDYDKLVSSASLSDF